LNKDKTTKKRLADTLRFQLEDTAKSHKLIGEGLYERPPRKSRKSRSQQRTSLYFKELAPPTGRKLVGKMLKPKTSQNKSAK
jgi:polyphosphate kinase